MTASTRLRWSAPLVAGAVVAGVVAATPRLADAADPADLAPRTAAELLAAVAEADVAGLSGEVSQTSDLGLPALPSGTGGASALSLTDLVSGRSTGRLWAAGDDRARVAVDAPFGEYDVVRNGRDVWTYDSAGKEVTHLTLPERGQAPAPSAAPDPLAAAQAVLDLVDDDTDVSVGRSSVVAGRAAYELVLTPRDPQVLVGSVRLAVDGETSVPLRVRVLADGSTQPAVEVGFTSVRFEQPDDDVFAFSPPAGATVTERELPAEDEAGRKDPQVPAGTEVLGSGWGSVVSLRGVDLTPGAGAQPAEEGADTAALLDALTTPVEGGRVVTSRLVSVLVTDDGRLLAGAVPAARLQQLAAR